MPAAVGGPFSARGRDMSDDETLKTLTLRGLSAFRQHDYEAAIAAFQQALALDELQVGLHEALATAFFQLKRYDEAVHHFTRITRLAPQLGKPHFNLGAVYNRMGQYDKAVDALRRGLAKDKRCSEAYYNLGIAHRGQGQLGLAISAYKEAIRIAPQMAEAHQNLANVYIEMQNYRQAIAHFRTALEIRPDFDRARRGLEYAEEARAQAEQAISPFGRLADSPESRSESLATHTRRLSDAERLSDRQQVRQLAIGIDATARQLLKQLRDNLEPKILSLTRAVAQGSEYDSAVVGVHPAFQEAVAACDQLSRSLTVRTRALRDHEQQLAPKS